MKKTNENFQLNFIFLIIYFVIIGIYMAPSAHAEANNKHLIGNHPEISKLLKYLKKDDVETYERIFSLQKDGAWNKANIEIKKLENKILIGHVMAQRYLHPTKYRSKYKELKDWMKKYSDHPQSRRIYKLALRRKPKDEILKFKPSAPAYVPNYFSPQTNTAKEKYSKKERIAYAKLRRKVSRFLKKDQVTKAVNFLEEDRSYQSLGGSMKAKLLNKIALGYLYSEKINLAERFSQRSVNLSKNHLHSSLWIAGLVKWKLGKFDQSITYLERITQLENIPKSVLAKSTYWLARANLINRKPEETIKWLKITAAYSDTFYGNLARRNLNLPIKLPNNSMPSIKKIELDEIREKKRGARSFALLQIKQHELAEKELIILYSDNPRKFYLPLLSLSVDMKLPRLAMKLAKDSDPDEKKFYQALFPIPKWNLKDSKNIDRALIYAIIRQESEFNASAKSRAGARGLMQILPRTAMSVAKQQKIRYLGRWQLMEAEKNIELGRKYISKLLKRKSINNNLVFMSVAYNSGIRNLAKWQKKMNFLNDPLLFIEMIPIRETKGYVKKIFNNIWFYREILGQDKASLDLLASGEWPEYVHLDQR